MGIANSFSYLFGYYSFSPAQLPHLPVRQAPAGEDRGVFERAGILIHLLHGKLKYDDCFLKKSFQGFESADSVPYDVEYTLRLLAENGLGRESVLLYCLLGQLEAAVGIALVGQIWQLYVRLERICCSLGHRLTLPKKSSFIFLVKNNHRSSLFQVCIFGISVNKYFFIFF